MFDRKDDPSIFSDPTVKRVAEKLGKSPAQVTLLVSTAGMAALQPHSALKILFGQWTSALLQPTSCTATLHLFDKDGAGFIDRVPLPRSRWY